MKVNYKELSERYRLSGLSKKDFGEQIKMSPSMVSYYVKKAEEDEQAVNGGIFSQIELGSSKTKMVIKISTSRGLTIEVPI